MPGGHPAGCLYCLRRHAVVRIFLVVSPGIVAEDGVNLEQTKQKDEPGADFRARQVVHAVIAIAEVEPLLQARRLQESFCVTLIAEYGFTQSQVVGVFLVVAGADEVSGITFPQEFGDGAAGKKRTIIQMRRDQGQYLALVRRSRYGPLSHDIRRRVNVGRQLRHSKQTCGRGASEEITPFHSNPSMVDGGPGEGAAMPTRRASPGRSYFEG